MALPRTRRRGTALWDALFDSMAFLRQQAGRRAVVVLSDGRDENNPGTAPGSAHTLEDVLTQIRDTGTTVDIRSPSARASIARGC